MKMNESFGLCPYLSEMERESKRNARIRNDEKWTEFDTDITTAEEAHLKRRKEKPARNRWIRMAMEIEKKLDINEPLDWENAETYLLKVKAEVDSLGFKASKEKRPRPIRFGRLETV